MILALIFACLVCLCLVVLRRPRDDVIFQPYEQDIRQLILKNDPSQLHKVDTWLANKSGEQLLQDLRAEFDTLRGVAGLDIR